MPLHNGPLVAYYYARRNDSNMRLRQRLSNIGAVVAAIAVLSAAGCSREPAAAYTGAGSTWDTSAAVVPANLAGSTPATQAIYSDQQTEPYADAPSGNGCAQPVAYGYTTPSYATRYGVRMVRPRVIEVQAPVYEERRTSRRGRSTGRSVAIVAGSAGVGAAIGAIAGGGKGAAIGAIAGGSGGFVYDRMTHNR